MSTIPVGALDERLGITGTTGAGKTYTAMGLVERLLAEGARCVIIDPLDVWWGLRLDAGGVKASGFSLPIFGGAHADLPLTEGAGALIGETVAGMAESCIVSLGGFKSGAAERRFMLAFLNALDRSGVRSLFHLVLDEADLWAPQQVLEKDGDAMALKGMVNTIVRRGRVKGFVPWLITQRPAVIDKSVMSMMAGLLAMKVMSPQDRDAVAGWLKGQLEPAKLSELTGSLPQLATGEGIAWLPSHGILERIQFPVKRTFDSSRAPKRGETMTQRDLVPLDLGALRERLGALDAELKATDPKQLRAEVVRLERALASHTATGGVPDQVAIARAAEEGFDRGLNMGRAEGRAGAFTDAIALVRAELQPVLDRLGDMMGALPTTSMAVDQPRPPKPARAAPPPAPAAPVADVTPAEPGALSSGAAKIVAMLERVWPLAMPLEDAAKHGGVGVKSSQFPGYKREVLALVERGGLERTASGELRALRKVGDASEVLAAYKRQWSPAYVSMLDVIQRHSPNAVARHVIIEAAGISPTSSTGGAGLKAMADEGVIIKTDDGAYVLAHAFQ